MGSALIFPKIKSPAALTGFAQISPVPAVKFAPCKPRFSPKARRRLPYVHSLCSARPAVKFAPCKPHPNIFRISGRKWMGFKKVTCDL